MVESWPRVSLPEVVWFQEGPGLRTRQWTNEGIKVINGRNVLTEGQIDLSNTDKYISWEEFGRKYEHFGVKNDDIVVTSSGTLGKVGRIRPEHLPLMMNTSVIRFRSGNLDLLDHDYLHCFLRSADFQNQIGAYAIGAAQPNFGPSHLKLMSLPLPPLAVQRQIAGTLLAYDELVESSERRIRILEAMARALYREWFVHFRFPGHENRPRTPSPLGEIPEGWEVKKLSDVLELNYGKALKKADRRDGPFPVYGSSGIVGTHDAYLVEGPGIIVGRKGNVGSVFWCDDDFYVIDTAYYISSDLPLRLLYYVLPMLNFINSDAAVPGLSRNQAYTLDILSPPDPLVEKFCDLAGTFERQASSLRNQIENLRRTRDLLLPRLLSRQLEPEAA
jgi:type I restriction enzyme, S subunit